MANAFVQKNQQNPEKSLSAGQKLQGTREMGHA
jgi:hypothetical protein